MLPFLSFQRKRVLEEEEEEEEVEPYIYVPPTLATTFEVSDPHRLAQRQKQIDIGKNTLGYQNYTEHIAKSMRQRFNPIHPLTPDIKDGCSKRCFDGKIRAWRRALHVWDLLPGQKCDNQIRVETKQVIKRPRMDTNKDECVDDETASGGRTDVEARPIERVVSSIFDDFDM